MTFEEFQEWAKPIFRGLDDPDLAHLSITVHSADGTAFNAFRTELSDPGMMDATKYDATNPDSWKRVGVALVSYLENDGVEDDIPKTATKNPPDMPET